MIAEGYPEEAATDPVNGVLPERSAESTRRVEGQLNGPTWLGVAGRRGITGYAAEPLPGAPKMQFQALVRSAIPFGSPFFACSK
jgi:hypothetical protein